MKHNQPKQLTKYLEEAFGWLTVTSTLIMMALAIKEIFT